jgi:hypothetical protein
MIAQVSPQQKPLHTGPIQVEARDTERWQRRLMEGQRQGLLVEVRAHSREAQVETAIVTVSSHATPGARRTVLVQRVGTTVSVWCSCPAGDFRALCTHCALALEATRMWPEGVTLHRQASLLTPQISGAVDPDELVCSCCGLPARTVARRDGTGDAVLFAVCPGDGMLIAPITRERWVEGRIARQPVEMAAAS